MISSAISLVATMVLWIRLGAATALCLLLGAAVAIVNLRWLEHSVSRMFDVQTEKGKAGRLWPKMLARYFFLGAVAYVIFTGYLVSVGAFLAGLFVPIAALMVEAAYEAYVASKS
jgi:ATP synthase I chain